VEEQEMLTYVILSRFSPEAFREPKEFKKLADDVSSKIRKECKGIVWKYSFATLGRFDVVDVVEAENAEEVQRAAMIIRGHGHSSTETLLATPWKDFLASL
jgi:uncharacterized protein with GYD domain